MYIKSARITNIRSIEDFEINFEEPAGWHVLIGDNGSGKSTIIRSLALALVGDSEISVSGGVSKDLLKQDPNKLEAAPRQHVLIDDPKDWLRQNTDEGRINVIVSISNEDKYPHGSNIQRQNASALHIVFRKVPNSSNAHSDVVKFASPILSLIRGEGWFSTAYGPYRKFSGGSQEWYKIFANQPILGAHLSAFGEDVALSEPIGWLMDQVKNIVYERIADKMFQLKYGKKAGNNDSDVVQVLENIIHVPVVEDLKKLINSSGFLPNNTILEDVSFEGVFFRDGNGILIDISQLSDGYRSILSLTFELIRQLIRVYDEESVFENIRKDDMRITLPGVVLIDEIDAHLHPTWQTKIGQWFTKYFPNLQFIVTTHSPLVCRAAIKGTIWKLAEPGSDEKSKEIIGIDRDRLIYGNLIEAYGTGAFEEDVSPSENSEKMRKELADLSKKSFKGIITDIEKQKMNRIKEILPAS